jgi:hypothetical protein
MTSVARELGRSDAEALEAASRRAIVARFGKVFGYRDIEVVADLPGPHASAEI